MQINANSSGDENYTPEILYNIIKDRVLEIYPQYAGKIVRPFWPGADYKKVDYPDGCLVLDNPPFSINKEIAAYYDEHNIKYFLFTQGITGIKKYMRGFVSVGNLSIKYSKQSVNTAFYTNLFEGIVLDGELYYRLAKAMNIHIQQKHPSRRAYYQAATLAAFVVPHKVNKLDAEEVNRHAHTVGREFIIYNYPELRQQVTEFNKTVRNPKAFFKII